jgi:hypothetical protein
MDKVLARLKSEHIHSIARIVCFNDPILARKRPDWAIRSSRGGLWRNRHGPWVDPTIHQVWQYNIDLALDAARRGFDEIQWDYVRFPSDGNTRLCVYRQPVSHDRAAGVIDNYLALAYKSLASTGLPITADIFGLTGTSKSDMGIGQKITLLSRNVDGISPMVYPSHFAHGEYRLPNPNAEPYKTVLFSLRDARKRLTGTRTVIRPWLQAFTLGHPPYGPPQFLAQVKAVRDDHLSQFLCWNAANRYDIVISALSSREGKALLASLAENATRKEAEAVAVPGAAARSGPPAAMTGARAEPPRIRKAKSLRSRSPMP